MSTGTSASSGANAPSSRPARRHGRAGVGLSAARRRHGNERAPHDELAPPAAEPRADDTARLDTGPRARRARDVVGDDDRDDGAERRARRPPLRARAAPQPARRRPRCCGRAHRLLRSGLSRCVAPLQRGCGRPAVRARARRLARCDDDVADVAVVDRRPSARRRCLPALAAQDRLPRALPLACRMARAVLAERPSWRLPDGRAPRRLTALAAAGR